MAGDLKSITGVEIFAVGRWNGDAYSEADLDEMVRAFTENKATLKPAIKLGHDESQKLLQKDGFPAAGWISNVYRVGGKLLADFIDMPAKIYELIERKAYRKVSSEVYWNIEINGRKYKRMLSAVSLLGGDMPAVSTLNDILSLYGARKADRVGVYATNPDDLMIRQYCIDTVESPEATRMGKTEAEIKLEYELKQQNEKLEGISAQMKKYEQDSKAHSEALAAKENELEELKKFKAQADERAAVAEKQAAETKLDQVVSDLEKDKLVTPAMKPYIRALLGEEKKEYAIADKKLDKAELMRETLKLFKAAADVNFEENTKASDDGDKTSVNGKDAAQNAKIEKYMADNKVNYSVAYRAVMKQEK